MAAAVPVELKESFFSIFRWRGIDDIVRCFNNYFKSYYPYIIAKKTGGGFFLNIYDSRGKIAHMSFHKGDKGLGGIGQTHFKFDNPPSLAYGIGLEVTGGSRATVTSINIEAIEPSVNTFLDYGHPSLREAVNNALLYVFKDCVPNNGIRATPKRLAGETAATARVPGGRRRRRGLGAGTTARALFGVAPAPAPAPAPRPAPAPPAFPALGAGVGTGGSKSSKKRKFKARMTKQKRKVNGLTRNVRISKTGRKYVILKGKRHFL